MPAFLRFRCCDGVIRFIYPSYGALDNPDEELTDVRGGSRLRTPLQGSGSVKFGVHLDTLMMSSSLQLSDDQQTIRGSGKILGNTQLLQDKAYYEVVVVAPGKFHVGVSHYNTEFLDTNVGDDQYSWGTVFTSDLPKGTVIGCAFDQSDFPLIRYYLDGNPTDIEIGGLRGTFFPAISIEEDAEVQVLLDSSVMKKSPPLGFNAIIKSRNLI